MMVFSPSLPPESSTTTRTVSFPASAALPVFTKNCGTADPTASNEVPCKLRIRNLRRLNMAVLSFMKRCLSRQLILRHRHDRMYRFPDPPVPRGPFRFSFSHKSNQLPARFLVDFALEDHSRQHVDDALRLGDFLMSDQM